MFKVVRSLRFWLLALVLIALVPIWGFNLLSAWYFLQEHAAEWHQECLQSVVFVGNTEATLIDDTRQLLAAAASSQQLASDNEAVYRSFLGRLQRESGGFRSVGLLATNGEVLYSTLPLVRRTNVLNQSCFRQVAEKHQFGVGMLDLGEREPACAFLCWAKLGTQHRAGVVFATLEPKWLQSFADSIQGTLPPSSTWTGIDENGNILFRYPESERWAGKLFPERELLAVVTNRISGVENVVCENKEMVCAFYRIPERPKIGNDLWIICQTPREALLASSRQAVQRVFLWLSVISLGAVGLAWWCSRYFVMQGVEKLLETLARFQTGDCRARVGKVPGVDEIKSVARAFDEMAAAVEHRERERRQHETFLRESEMKYRTLFENTVVGFYLLRENKVVDCNQQCCRLFRCAREDFVGHRVEELFPPYQPDGQSSLAAAADLHARMERAQPLSFVWHFRCRDGTGLDAEVTLSRLEFSAEEVLLVTVHDVTQMHRAEQSLRELSGRLLRLQDEERRSIARELHDNTAQLLAALSMNLSLMETCSTPQLEAKRVKLLQDCRHLVKHCSREVRTLSYLLHPPLLDEMGLVDAIREYVDGFSKRSGITIQVSLPEARSRFPREVEVALFRILQECLTNIHRHSGANAARIELKSAAKELCMEIEDNGRGMAGEVKPGEHYEPIQLGVGITGMRERLRQLGGSLEIESDQAGTLVRVRVPCRETEL